MTEKNKEFLKRATHHFNIELTRMFNSYNLDFNSIEELEENLNLLNDIIDEIIINSKYDLKFIDVCGIIDYAKEFFDENR